MNLSITKISTYLDCPRKYWYTYHMRIFTPKSEGFYFGSAVHQGLEYYYLGKDPMQGVKDALYGEKSNASEEPVEGIDLSKLEYEAQRIFDKYSEAPYFKPLMVEHIFKVKLINPVTKEELKVNFVGKMDLITEDSKIVDHKTASSSPNGFFEAKNTLQANGYSYAFLRMFGKLPGAFIFNTIIKGNTRREPRFEPKQRKIQLGDICSFFDTSRYVLDAILREETRNCPNRSHCRFCRFKSICQFAI